jgi:DNA-binding response OmpR family regulator
MRVLGVRADFGEASKVKKHLQKENVSVDLAETGAEAEEKALSNQYDVIFLDGDLTDIPTLQVVKDIRNAGNEAPIMVIAEQSEDRPHVAEKFLHAGADDYITRPVYVNEMWARAMARIRRAQGAGRTRDDIVVGKLHVMPWEHFATYNDKPLDLRPRELDILIYIAAAAPKPVSAEFIAEHVYGEDFDPTSTVLRVHLASLKKKVNKAAGYSFMTTMRGIGYRIMPEDGHDLLVS